MNAARAALACTIALAMLAPARAEQTSVNGTTTSARLDFVVDMGKFLFFRVGTGAFPGASGTVDTVTFNAVPTIPAGAVVPVPGNNTTVNWSGALPTFTTTNTVLPVEVRSNAGQISIRATATTPLTSGPNSIPLSQIVLTSSDVNLPAPVLPNAGTGAAVNVTGTAFTNLVTVRNANWTFAYNPAITQPAGNYSGQVTFTASSP